jgi:twitching motility protein PilT
VRLNGELHPLEMQPLKPEDLQALAEQIMTPRQVKEFAEKKEADFAIGVPGVGPVPHQHLPAARHARVRLPRHPRTRSRPSRAASAGGARGDRPQARGLDSGHGDHRVGKSTALAAMINHINQNRRVNVITIEDPIEFLHRDVMSNISQRESASDTLSFAAALRTCCGRNPT